ncbi:hypothetical protein LJR084_001897 [Variovorax sp. LjRoot84]|uniref:hypothetical protein n=1 Tax=Variovorax sp. LjRoot84 TaxID=3342340 RepID=UPI003ED011FB
MKPVMQDAFGELGNCFSACLASLFELDITDVPNFYVTAGRDDAAAWWSAVREWLRPRGFGVMTLQWADPKLIGEFEGWFIVCGESERGLQHATIWRDGKLVHDPHPSQCGIRSPESVDLLYPLDPGAMLPRSAR